MANTARTNGAVLGGPKDPPKPTKEQQDKAAAVMAELRAAQKALQKNDTDANRHAVAKATAKYRALPDLFFSYVPRGGRRRKTRGGACSTPDATLSELGLVYMGNCLWQHRDKKDISPIPKGFTKTTLHGKPAYVREAGGRRRTTRRGARASRTRPTR